MRTSQLLRIFKDEFTAQQIANTVNLDDYEEGGALPDFAPSLLAKMVGIKFDVGNIMAYGFRRFGSPVSDWDDCKEICEWIITTPNPAVFVKMKPSRTSPFGFAVHRDVWQTLFAEIASRKPNGCVEACQQAITRALQDLLRPVEVDDWAINVNGKIAQSRFCKMHVDADGDETDEYIYNFCVPYAQTSGRGSL